MTKQQKIFAVISVSVFLLALLTLIEPIGTYISQKRKYAEWNVHLVRAAIAFFEQDYSAAYDAYMEAYESVIPENDYDRDMLSQTIRLAAECQTQLGDLDAVIAVLQRGYRELDDDGLASSLMACPVRFSVPKLHTAFCKALGTAEDALTYRDLLGVESITVHPDVVHVYTSAGKRASADFDVSETLETSALFCTQLSYAENAAVHAIGFQSTSGGLFALGQIKNLRVFYTVSNRYDDYSFLSSMTSLWELYMNGTDIAELSPLASMTELKRLDLSNCPNVTDLSPLASLTELEHLNLSITACTDLTPLSSLNRLQILHLSEMPITDLTPLAALENLQELSVSYTKVSSLAPLAFLPSLRVLWANNCALTDITPLQKVSSLVEVNLTNNEIRDISPLADKPLLQIVDIGYNPISDLSPLAGNGAIRAINCPGAQISDLLPLSGMTQLKSLFLPDNQITDISPLQNLSNLEELDLTDNRISDIAALAGKSNLINLSLGNNPITDLTPLSDCTSIYFLQAPYMKVTDVAPLANLNAHSYLNLDGNPITDWSPVFHIDTVIGIVGRPIPETTKEESP